MWYRNKIVTVRTHETVRVVERNCETRNMYTHTQFSVRFVLKTIVLTGVVNGEQTISNCKAQTLASRSVTLQVIPLFNFVNWKYWQQRENCATIWQSSIQGASRLFINTRPQSPVMLVCVEIHCWQERRHCTAAQCWLCTGSGRVSLLTKAGTLHCATVMSVHKEGQSFIADKSRDTSLRHSDVCAQGVAEFRCWQKQGHFAAPQWCLCREWQSFIADKSRNTSLRHSVVCAQGRAEFHCWQNQGHFTAPQWCLCTESGRFSLLTKAGTLHCATVLSVHKEGQSFIADKSRDTSLRHSDVCAQGSAEFHCWQNQGHFTAPQCCLCTESGRVSLLTRTCSIGLLSLLSCRVSIRLPTYPDIKNAWSLHSKPPHQLKT